MFTSKSLPEIDINDIKDLCATYNKQINKICNDVHFGILNKTIYHYHLLIIQMLQKWLYYNSFYFVIKIHVKIFSLKIFILYHIHLGLPF